MASQEDIAELKADWLNDPEWDIEDTKGFELHRLELLAFRISEDAKIKAGYCAKKVAEIDSLNPVKMLETITRLREALVQITQECGKVCSEFELCTHEACNSSSAAYLIAIEAINNDKASVQP